MSNARRPSLWSRLITRRHKGSEPDFGDMGTAFGLEAITPVILDWSLAEPIIEVRSDSASALVTRPAGKRQATTTSEPS